MSKPRTRRTVPTGETRADGKPIWSGRESRTAYLARLDGWQPTTDTPTETTD